MPLCTSLGLSGGTQLDYVIYEYFEDEIIPSLINFNGSVSNLVSGTFVFNMCTCRELPRYFLSPTKASITCFERNEFERCRARDPRRG